MNCPIYRKNINEEMTEYIQQNNSDSDNSTESSLDSNMGTLENFIGVTVSLLDNVPYVPLPEAPYLDGVDLPVAVEGGPREKIKNMLICLFADDDYFYRELYWGSFSRSILLPHEIEIESVEAVEKHGLLIVRLPKVDKARQAKVKVKSI